MTGAHYPQVPGHKGTSPTGRLAAEAYTAKAPSKRARVFNQLAHGPQTAEQIAEALGDHWYLCRPRISELKAMGLAVETGQFGKGALGGKVNIWRCTTEEERAAFSARKSSEEAQ